MKNASLTPAFKKGNRNSKDNYRPVSILPNVYKIFERCIFCQIADFMDQFLSKYQCGFREGYNTQYCFLFKSLKNRNLQLIKKTIDALLTNLSKHVSPWSKAFDFELLLAKLHACGFIIAALRVTHSYLANREQR